MLARFAAESGLEVTECHYPPGASRGNKVEHRLFSFTMNWPGRPLVSYRTVIEMISATTSKNGLRVWADVRDWNWYETGVKISDDELAAVPLTPHRWRGDWNHTASG